jgi:hypothetical protein
MTAARNEASRASFSPAVRRLVDYQESQGYAMQDVIALGGLDKALDVEEMARAFVAPTPWDDLSDAVKAEYLLRMRHVRASILDVPGGAR